MLAVYLLGRVRTLSELTTKTQNQVLPAKTEPENIPTTKPQVIYKPSVPNPTQALERKKVAVTVTEAGVAGTYYCYEENANTLIQKQVELNNLHKFFDFCADDLRYKINNCNYNDTSSPCPTGTECDGKSQDVMSAQDELSNMIYSFCP